MEIEKLTALGKELGLEGAELREWVEEQQEWAKEVREWEREDREWEREKKEREERYKKEREERDRIAAKEAEELQLKLQELRMKLRSSVHETTLDTEASDKSAHAFHVKETVPYKCDDWGQVAVSSKTEDGETASKDCDPVVEERKDISGQDEVESINDGNERAVLNAAQYSKEAVESVDAFEPQDTVVEHNFEEQSQAANSCNEEGDSEEPAVAPEKVGAKENESDESFSEEKAGAVMDGSESKGHLDEPGQCHVLGGLSVKEKEQQVTSCEMESEGWLSCEQAEFSEVENVGRDATCLEVGGVQQCIALEDDPALQCTNGSTEEMALPEPRQSSDIGMSRRLATVSVAEGQDRQWMPRKSTVGRRTDSGLSPAAYEESSPGEWSASSDLLSTCIAWQRCSSVASDSPGSSSAAHGWEVARCYRRAQVHTRFRRADKQKSAYTRGTQYDMSRSGNEMKNAGGGHSSRAPGIPRVVVYVFGRIYQYFQFPVGGFFQVEPQGIYTARKNNPKGSPRAIPRASAASEQSVSAIPGPFHFWPHTGETGCVRALWAPGGPVCAAAASGARRLWPRVLACLGYGRANFPSVAFLSGLLGNDPRGLRSGSAGPGGPVRRTEVTTPASPRALALRPPRGLSLARAQLAPSVGR
ncbi:hypothetical protein HPB50_013536 [Hyalomma asiaticum]|uniref:Uncharacterized protein n=1 Tax=Hyalomma asiaticum TaxID=266040 RepID=A0ACB7THL6_HYAAI|nr:hypothetical protein HPB50_013536 [Hyalomma asiaticum]